MKRIQVSNNPQAWPRKAVNTIECRKRDLVIRIADWMSDKDEPCFDVEVYIGGFYDWNESKCCATKAEAIAFATAQTARLL